MTTVQQLLDYLNQVKDKSKPICILDRESSIVNVIQIDETEEVIVYSNNEKKVDLILLS